MPECEFRDILTEERCSDFRCAPYRVMVPDGNVLERWLCETHAFMLDEFAVPA